MSTVDTALLRELAQAATPGPWEDDGDGGVSQHWSRPSPWEEVVSRKVDYCIGHCYGGVGKGVPRSEDRAYIAAASPDVILALLDEVEALRAAVEREVAR